MNKFPRPTLTFLVFLSLLVTLSWDKGLAGQVYEESKAPSSLAAESSTSSNEMVGSMARFVRYLSSQHGKKKKIEFDATVSGTMSALKTLFMSKGHKKQKKQEIDDFFDALEKPSNLRIFTFDSSNDDSLEVGNILLELLELIKPPYTNFWYTRKWLRALGKLASEGGSSNYQGIANLYLDKAFNDGLGLDLESESDLLPKHRVLHLLRTFKNPYVKRGHYLSKADFDRLIELSFQNVEGSTQRTYKGRNNLLLLRSALFIEVENSTALFDSWMFDFLTAYINQWRKPTDGFFTIADLGNRHEYLFHERDLAKQIIITPRFSKKVKKRLKNMPFARKAVWASFILTMYRSIESVDGKRYDQDVYYDLRKVEEWYRLIFTEEEDLLIRNFPNLQVVQTLCGDALTL